MAPPTESQILTSFLLTPAPLPTITPLSVFTTYFPPPSRSSSEIKRLYRALQQRRALLTDSIAKNIEREVKHGREQRREISKAHREELEDDGEEEQLEEIEIERALFGPTSNLPSHNQQHTLSTLGPELEKAATDIEAEIAALESETDVILAEIREVVGGMSDLRYGKVGNPELREEALGSLAKLEEVAGGK